MTRGFLLPTWSLALLTPYVLCFLPNLFPSCTLAKKVLFCHLLLSQRSCDASASGCISSARITWLTWDSFQGLKPAVVGLQVQWDGLELLSGILHWGSCWFQSCLSRCVCVNASQTIKWESWTQQAGNFLLFSLHPSCASLHFSSVCLCSSLKHCAQRAQTSCSWSHAVHCVLVVLGRAKLRQKLAFPWQQQLELWAQPVLCCPSDVVEPLGASSCRVFQSLHPLSCSPAWGNETRQVSGWPLRRGEDGRICHQALFHPFFLSVSWAMQGNRHKTELSMYSYEILSQSLLEIGTEIGA